MEFAEVMKPKGRLCDSNAQCSNCILSSYNNGTDIDCGKFMTTYPEEAEKLIMKWAEEHPVKTNRQVFIEAMQEKFGDALDLDILNGMLDEQGCNLINGECHSSGSCNTCNQSNFWDKEYKEVE